MMKWSRLCFLVLTVSTISKGRADRSTPNNDRHDIPTPTAPTATLAPAAPGGPGPLNKTENNTITAPPAPPPSDNPASENATDNLSADNVTGVDKSLSNTTVGSGSGTKASATTSASMKDGAGDDGAMVSTATTGSAVTPGTIPDTDRSASSWGYVVLVLIILVIIILCVILYFLRRVSRTYSFDLQRPDPIINQFNEPTGTGFEPVYLDDLDRPAPKDEVITNDLSPAPVSNGTSLQLEEKDTDGENDPQPEVNGVETSPPSNTSPSSGDDPADKTSDPPSSTDLIFDASGETQQNENNNNPSIFSTDPFVEINLDEPAWSDQLLTPPLATSSVLPFSPFSFSSSSSS